MSNKKTKIYISGPISGLKPEEYEAAFGKAEAGLLARGYEVVNPLRHVVKGASWEEQMKVDIRLLLECDGIYMLDGWETSKGAKMEHGIATSLGLWAMSASASCQPKLAVAVCEVTGVTMKDIRGGSRKQKIVYARMIYAAESANLDRNQTIVQIGEDMNRNHSTVLYYIRQYYNEREVNGGFRKMADKVRERLE